MQILAGSIYTQKGKVCADPIPAVFRLDPCTQPIERIFSHIHSLLKACIIASCIFDERRKRAVFLLLHLKE